MSCRIRKLFPVFVTACIAFLLSGCGYRIHGHAALPFTEVKIGLLRNETIEPKLQDRLHRALTEEFLRQGIGISEAAEHTLTGVIHRFEMIGLSEKGGITVEYRIVISVDFRLADNKGNTAATKSVDTPFIVSFTGTGDLGGLVASRETAEEQAMRDVASEIVGALIYR